MLLSWAKRKHMFEEIRLSESEFFFPFIRVSVFSPLCQSIWPFLTYPHASSSKAAWHFQFVLQLVQSEIFHHWLDYHEEVNNQHPHKNKEPSKIRKTNNK